MSRLGGGTAAVETRKLHFKDLGAYWAKDQSTSDRSEVSGVAHEL